MRWPRPTFSNVRSAALCGVVLNWDFASARGDCESCDGQVAVRSAAFVRALVDVLGTAERRASASLKQRADL